MKILSLKEGSICEEARQEDTNMKGRCSAYIDDRHVIFSKPRSPLSSSLASFRKKKEPLASQLSLCKNKTTQAHTKITLRARIHEKSKEKG